jgi:nucleoid DNA-binding protein
LKPLKAKELIPKVVAECGLKQEEVEDIIGFYWQEVRKSLSGLEHSRVHLTNLGDFTIKHWKLDDKIQMLEKFEENNQQKGLQKITARFKTAETLYDLRNIKELISQEKQRADFIKMHKSISHETRREHDPGLESQGSDSGGN